MSREWLSPWDKSTLVCDEIHGPRIVEQNRKTKQKRFFDSNDDFFVLTKLFTPRKIDVGVLFDPSAHLLRLRVDCVPTKPKTDRTELICIYVCMLVTWDFHFRIVFISRIVVAVLWQRYE